MTKQSLFFLSVISIIFLSIWGYLFFSRDRFMAENTLNLITNPSVESHYKNKPFGWNQDSWGELEYGFRYEEDGDFGLRSLSVEIFDYQSGDAKWFFDPVEVEEGAVYTYKNYYRSDVSTSIVVQSEDKDGIHRYHRLTKVRPSDTWTQIEAQWKAPKGTTKATVYHLIDQVGTLDIDGVEFYPDDRNDFVTQPDWINETYEGFEYSMVSISFDDGWLSQFTNASEILDKYGYNATYYITTDYIGQEKYMTQNMLSTLVEKGDHIGSHSVSHKSFLDLSDNDLISELTKSQQYLDELNIDANDIASPFGDYDKEVISVLDNYYDSHRGTESGYNDKDNYDRYNLKTQNITNMTTLDEIQTWIDMAETNNYWLILVYHRVDKGSDTYIVSVDDFSSHLDLIEDSDLQVVTVEDALDIIDSQL